MGNRIGKSERDVEDSSYHKREIRKCKTDENDSDEYRMRDPRANSILNKLRQSFNQYDNELNIFYVCEAAKELEAWKYNLAFTLGVTLDNMASETDL